MGRDTIDSIIYNIHKDLGDPVLRLSVLENDMQTKMNAKGVKRDVFAGDNLEPVLLMNNGWNDRNEQVLINLGENAASYRWLHEKSSLHFSFVSKVLSILVILFSTGMSAQTIVPRNTYQEALDITNQVFVYIITIISVIQRFLKYEQRSTNHMNQSREFGRLYTDIQQKMTLYRREREDAKLYMARIIKQYDDIIQNSPAINEIILTKFKNAFKDSNIAIPSIADKIDKIEKVDEEGGKIINAQTNGAIGTNGVIGTNGAIGTIGPISRLADINNCIQEYSDSDVRNMSSEKILDMNNRYINNITKMHDYEYNRFINQ
jgi:hypothetical protein